jgi:hypothetical protein
MRFLATILAAISVAAFTFDIVSARIKDNPNSYYDASGKGHSGRLNTPSATGKSKGRRRGSIALFASSLLLQECCSLLNNDARRVAANIAKAGAIREIKSGAASTGHAAHRIRCPS